MFVELHDQSTLAIYQDAQTVRFNEPRISEFSEVERELEEPVSNTLRVAGRPPASAVFGLFIVLALFGSALYILCFYLK